MKLRCAFALALVVVAASCAGDATDATTASPPDAAVTAATAATTTIAVETESDLPWWNDRVFYEIFVRSFKDADGDGIGDFAGLTASLDYLNDGDPATTNDLGITGIWLMPIFPSPTYHGYDVTDYRNVNPDYGTMEDFRTFLAAAHERGIAVIIDLVINHTSSEHPWFVAAASGDPGYEDWYRWSDTDPGTTAPWGAPAWHEREGRYYFGLFWEGMPDLNLENAEVTAELRDIARFWLEDVGVDGFRLDAARHLIEDGNTVGDTPATIAWLEDFNAHVDSVAPEALVLGEVWAPTVAVARYIPDALDLAFEFDLAEWAGTAAADQDATALGLALANVARSYPELQYATFLTNHDMNRVMSEVGGDVRIAKLAGTSLLTGPGVPFVYYGEEIGLQGVKPDERIRTPMPWRGDDAGVGFTTGTPWQPADRHYPETNVAAQLPDPESLLSHYRTLIHARAASPALRRGDVIPVESNSPATTAYLRSEGSDHVLVVLNLSDGYAVDPVLHLAAGPLAGHEGVIPLIGPPAAAPDVNAQGGFDAYRPLASIPPYGFLVLRFTPEPSPAPPTTTTTTSTTLAVFEASASDIAVVEGLLEGMAGGDARATWAVIAADAVIFDTSGELVTLDEPLPFSSGADARWDWDGDGIVTIGDVVAAENEWWSLLVTSFEYECFTDGDLVTCRWLVGDVFSAAAGLGPAEQEQSFRVADGAIVGLRVPDGEDPSTNPAWQEQFAAYERWLAEAHPEAHAVVFHEPCCTGNPENMTLTMEAMELQRTFIPAWVAANG